MDGTVPNIRIARYRKSPYWQVWADDELVVMSCSHDMALAIKRAFSKDKSRRKSSGTKKKRSNNKGERGNVFKEKTIQGQTKSH